MVVVLLVLLLYWLLHTDLGLALRATGENEKMVRAQGIDADAMRLIGLALCPDGEEVRDHLEPDRGELSGGDRRGP